MNIEYWLCVVWTVTRNQTHSPHRIQLSHESLSLSSSPSPTPESLYTLNARTISTNVICILHTACTCVSDIRVTTTATYIECLGIFKLNWVAERHHHWMGFLIDETRNVISIETSWQSELPNVIVFWSLSTSCGAADVIHVFLYHEILQVHRLFIYKRVVAVLAPVSCLTTHSHRYTVLIMFWHTIIIIVAKENEKRSTHVSQSMWARAGEPLPSMASSIQLFCHYKQKTISHLLHWHWFYKVERWYVVNALPSCTRALHNQCRWDKPQLYEINIYYFVAQPLVEVVGGRGNGQLRPSIDSNGVNRVQSVLPTSWKAIESSSSTDTMVLCVCWN